MLVTIFDKQKEHIENAFIKTVEKYFTDDSVFDNGSDFLFLEQFCNFGLQKCFLRFLEFAELSLMLLPKTLSIPSAWASPETSMKSVRRSPQKIIRRQLAPLEVYFHSSGVNMPEYRKPTVDAAPK